MSEANEPAIPGAKAIQAIEQNNVNALRQLIEADADLLTYCDPIQRNTLLTFAAVTKKPMCAEGLIGLGADIHATDEVGWTPLHAAAYGNPVEQDVDAVTHLLQLLIDAGANVHGEVRGSGGTPLAQALFRGCQPQVDILASHAITPLNLRMAAGLGRLDLTESLFNADGSLTAEAGAQRGYYRPHNSFPEWQPTDDPQEILDEAFVYACANGRLEMLDFLVAKGAAIDRDPYHSSPLHWAVVNNHVDVAVWLLDRGVSLQRLAGYGAEKDLSPLHVAAWGGFVEIVKFLVERGADHAYQESCYGATPLGWAQFNGREAVAEYLQTLQ